MTLRGLTWDHPRGRTALEAASAISLQQGGAHITWDARSLEQFEAQSIDEIAENYDIVVLDHPHLGEAIREGSLLALDDVLPRELLEDIEATSVGPSYVSYQMGGKLWAVPLDAATQVAAALCDRVAEIPTTWTDVHDLSRREPVALSLAGPHAFLTFASVCAGFGEPVGEHPDQLVSADTAAAVLDTLHGIAAHAPADSHTLNPIAMLERMSTEGDISYVPLIYGYVNYSTPALKFANSPTRVAGGPTGSIIGGTGLALTRRCTVSDDLIAFIAWLLSREMQTRFIPLRDGQPSQRTAWLDPLLDAASHGFYSNTLRTMENSTVRPRYDGYIAFQAVGSAIIRSLLLDGIDRRTGIDRLQQAYRSSLATHRRAS